MKKRELIIGDPERERIKQVSEFARDRSNWFNPIESDFLPAEKEGYVAVIPRGHKCVFTYTQDNNSSDLFRHLTISVTGNGNYPHERSIFMLAGLFGFRRPKEVGVLVDTKNERIILIEKVSKPYGI